MCSERLPGIMIAWNTRSGVHAVDSGGWSGTSRSSNGAEDFIAVVTALWLRTMTVVKKRI
jgi:hypothetical protein